ncbi:hypothetical protein [Rummeliibacillus pycnus]|uniref:hypothetical protein n=1 Tax=Rummeliibacillus pycnus TaxID=101070 RepID=UPI0037CBDF53
MYPKVYHKLMKIFIGLLILALIIWIALSFQSKKLDRERKRLLEERNELMNNKENGDE